MACTREGEEGGGPRRGPPFRHMRGQEEHLLALREDLAEWLQQEHRLRISADDFMEKLETGVVLCKHANRVNGFLPEGKPVLFRNEVSCGSWPARDNVHNFIAWCRGSLGVKECLLFETDDLVMRKNEKNVLLCVMEVARRGARLGLSAPLLVQLEREIEAELAGGSSGATPPASLSLRGSGDEADLESEAELRPRRQLVTCDLRSLHERVAELLSRCSCPAQFPMLQVGDGKYRIGETQILIFVRVLRNHVMVRVGGGWDTLEHYLDKHDPCRCRSGRRISVSRISPTKSGSIEVHLNSHRPASCAGTPSSSRSSSVPPSPPSRRRSACEVASGGWTSAANMRPRTHRRPASADSSSEVSSSDAPDHRANADFLRRQRRYSPRKVMKMGEWTASEDESPQSCRSRIPTSATASPSHRRQLSASRSETSLFQSAVNRGSRTTTASYANCRRPAARQPPIHQRSSSSTRSSPARTPDWTPVKRRTPLSLQASPVKPVPPLLEEILHDSEVLDSDEKILQRMQKLINEYRARESSPDRQSEDVTQQQHAEMTSAKNLRRNSLSRIPVLTWHGR